MNDILVSESAEITDPELLALANNIVSVARLAMEKAVAYHADPETFPIASDTNSFEQLFLSRFQQLQPAVQEMVVTKVMESLKSLETVHLQHYGELAKINLMLPEPVEIQAQELLFDKILVEPNKFTVKDQPGKFPSVPGKDMLQLRIRKVTCIDETDSFLGTEIGKDEIHLGGGMLDNTALTELIPQFKVGDFDEADNPIVSYFPPKIIAEFDLRKGDLTHSTWPKTYMVAMVMAEQDNGDFPGFLEKLLEKTKEAAIAYSNANWGPIAGAVVGYVLGKVSELLKEMWGDDIFVPLTPTCTVGSYLSLFNNRSRSLHSQRRKGHGGEYEIEYDWHIVWAEMDEDWGTWESRGGKITGGPSAGSRQATITDMFARGTDDYLWQNSFVHDHWTGWILLDKTFILTSEPTVALNHLTPNRVNVFSRGKDGGAWIKVWDGKWQAWAPLGGQIVGAPSACFRTPTIIDVFARGTDDHLWQKTWNGTKWTKWTLRDDSFIMTSEPTVILNPYTPNRVDVFARGKDGGVWTKVWDGKWQAWKSLGGQVIGRPGACSRQTSIIDLFARGTDDRLWQKTCNQGHWGQWFLHKDGGTLTSAPAVDSMGPNHIHVFVRGKDGAVWQKWWTGD